MIRNYPLLAALVAMGLAASILLKNTKSIGTDVGGTPTAAAVMRDGRSPAEENPRADLTIVVFTDYQCPACRRSHPEMKRAVERDGRIRIVYKDWPIFGERSRTAARTALAAAEQGIYPEVHHNLMTAPNLGRANLRKAVEAAGGDWQQVQADLVHGRDQYDRQLGSNANQAFALGLGGTPGYLIGPVLVRGALSERQFLRTFDQARR